MKSKKYDYFVNVKELLHPLGENNFSAVAIIREIRGGEIDHNLKEIFGETREEVYKNMKNIIEQWIKINEK